MYGIPFYVGLVAPFIVIYLFNWAVYAVIVCELTKKCCKKNSGERTTGVRARQQLVAAITLSVLFGLGWGVGLVATEGVPLQIVRDIFSSLIIFCTAFQGFMVFCLQTLRSKEVRQGWIRFFLGMVGKQPHAQPRSTSVSYSYYRHRSNTLNRLHYDSSTIKNGLGSRSNDYECATLKKSVEKFASGMKTISFDESAAGEEQLETVESSMPTPLANIKEEVDAEAVSRDSSYQLGMKDGKTQEIFKDESMAVGPLDSMSQSLPVDEVQVNFFDSPQHTPEAKVTETSDGFCTANLEKTTPL